jgi:uncharacterized membrane protein YjfL (UPF0719 family)
MMALPLVARYFVAAVGTVIALLCIWGLFSPQKLVDYVKGVMDDSRGLAIAVGMRILLGLALLVAAGSSQFPQIFQVLGWLALAAAVVLLIVGAELPRKLIAGVAAMNPLLIRVWLLFGVAFGAFLSFAAI